MPAPRDLELAPGRRLPARLFTVRLSRSGGPGGQNVNRVATKVDLRLDLDGAAAVLGDEAVERIRRRLRNRLDAAGRLQVMASTHREQARNLEAARDRMRRLLLRALAPRRPRRRTRPTRASQERRLAEKKRRGAIKKRRARLEE